MLLIRLADRLHNMRTLSFHPSGDRRRSIALETLEIYANLAERIGLEKIKGELEDLSFAHIQPDAYESIRARLESITLKDESAIARIAARLKEDMAAEGLDAQVAGRAKSPFSIWRKMQRKNIAFEQLGDVVAFRALVDSVADCYHALGIVPTHYQMIPNEYDDYISTPKQNGYRSLHTCVIGPDKLRIEVQIKTREMHQVNEYGVAAHWSYKQGGSVEGAKFHWMRELLEILNQDADPEEFLENSKLAMYSDQVFVFSPRGDLITLPKGATPVDFAYAVHSGVGDRCIGAKVNGALKPLRTMLENGDQVEIMTSRIASPSPEWERFCVTAKAKSAVRRFLRDRQRDKYVELGRQMLLCAFKDAGREFADRAVESGLQKLKYPRVQDLYMDIGEGRRAAADVVESLFPEPKNKVMKVLNLFAPKSDSSRQARDRKAPARQPPVLGLVPGMSTHFAKCCHPVPGDPIVGVIYTGTGVTIHSRECQQLKNYGAERFIDVDWNPNADGEALHAGRLKMLISNDPGTLGSLSTLIAKHGGNISNLIMSNQSRQYADLLMDVEIRDLDHLRQLTAVLRASPLVASVDRANYS